MVESYEHFIDGTFSLFSWLVVAACFHGLATGEQCRQVLSEWWQTQEWNGKCALYSCSLGSMTFGLMYATTASLYYWINPTDLSRWECYPANLLVALWLFSKGLMHLFFVERISLTFSRSSLRLSSLKRRLLIGSIVFCNLSLALVVSVTIGVYIEHGYSRSTRRSINDIYSCFKATEGIRYELIGRVLAVPLIAFDIIFSIIEVRLYVRRLWHLVQRSSQSKTNKSFTTTTTTSMMTLDHTHTIKTSTQPSTTIHSGTDETPISIDPADSTLRNAEELSLPPQPMALSTNVSVDSEYHSQSSKPASALSVADFQRDAVNEEEEVNDPTPPGVPEDTPAAVSAKGSSDQAWAVRSMSSMLGSIQPSGIRPMMTRMRTMVEDDPVNRSFVSLATRTTTLASLAILSSIGTIVIGFVSGRAVAIFDLAINALCIYFCYDVSAQSPLNPACLKCFGCMDESLMPCLFLCCEFECCECAYCDCDRTSSNVQSTTTNGDDEFECEQ